MALIKDRAEINIKGKAAALKIVAAFLFALIFAAVCWLYINSGVLFKAEDRIIYDVNANAAVETDAEGAVHIAFDGDEGVYINKLLFGVENRTETPLSLKVTVNYGDKTYIYEDLNPIYVATEVVNLNLSGISEICIDSIAGDETKGGFSVGSIMVDNTLNKNPAAVIFAALFGFALTLLILFKETFIKKPELLFLLVCGTMGLSMIAALPGTKVGYDEETHLQSVVAMANFPEDELSMSREALYQMIITEYNNPEAMPETAEETAELDNMLSEKCDYQEGESTPDFKVMANRAPAYFFMALGAKTAMALGLSWTGLMVMIRLFNLIMYTALMYAAIKILPFGKMLMTLTGLFPQMVFMAVTCSYDPFIMGCMSLGYAFMLKGRKYTVPMLISFLLACLPKAVYAPVILMGIGVNAIPEKDASLTKGVGDDKRRRLWILLAGAAVFAVLIVLFILPTVIDPSESGDIRGGEVSEMTQIGFILWNPLTYAGILLGQMIRWAGKCWFGPDCMTYMGHIVNGTADFKGYYGAYMLMLAVTVALSYSGRFIRMSAAGDKTEAAGHETKRAGKAGSPPGLNASKRVLMIAMVFLSAVLIWTAMYVSFTPPGSLEIAGVQGRYFIPLMFPLYLALSGAGAFVSEYPKGGLDRVRSEAEPAGGRLESVPAVCYYLLEIAELTVLALTVWTAVICAFSL